MSTEAKIVLKAGVYGDIEYKWNVWVLDVAHEYAKRIFTDAQYDYIASQVKDLATELSPSHSVLCDVDAVEDFFELRSRGGILGGKNVRTFFGLKKGNNLNEIIILGTFIKQNNGATPMGEKIKIRRRWRLYLSINLK